MLDDLVAKRRAVDSALTAQEEAVAATLDD